MHAGNDELRMALNGILSGHFGAERRVIQLDRRPSSYQSSLALEELDVSLDDGTTLRLMFKNLCRESMLEEARLVKPDFLYDPRREILTYQDILAPSNMGTPTCYGTVVDDRKRRYWLFMERVQGRELYQIGDVKTWQEAARWLASMHRRFSSRAKSLAEKAPLLSYGKDFCRIWIHRAQEFFKDAHLDQADGVRWLAEHYEKVVERITALPVTFIHGEFYASNILVDERSGRWRICPIDWEMAALGPGLIDLAALISGRWSEEQKMALATAYISDGPTDSPSPDPDEVIRDLDYCRLHVAVQWLGWFGQRQPYWEHRQDWLAEALRLARKLA